MWKFPGLGSNLSYSSDNAESLTTWPPGKSDTWQFFFFFFWGAAPSHMEVPRLRVESELQLPAYTTATVTTGSNLNL